MRRGTPADITDLRKFRPWTFTEIKAELAPGTDYMRLGTALANDGASDLTHDTIMAQSQELKQTVRGPMELGLAVALTNIASENSKRK